MVGREDVTYFMYIAMDVTVFHSDIREIHHILAPYSVYVHINMDLQILFF
jgi:hypothetical protein